MNIQTRESNAVVSLVPLVLASACWGIATAITKFALTEFPPVTLLVIQLVVSVLFLWSVIAVSRVRVPTFRQWLPLGILGWLNPGLSYALSLLGLTSTTASMSTLLWATEPVLILLLAAFVLREQLTPTVVGLSAFALMGVVLAAGLTTLDGVLSGNVLGNALILSGVVCCAIYTIASSRIDPNVDTLAAIAVQQTVALVWALLLLPVQSLITNGASQQPYSSQAWLSAIASGVLYYALAFWFYLRGLRRVSATFAGMFINLVPVFGIAGAHVLLGERMTSTQWLGAGLVVCAVGAIGFLQLRKATAAITAMS